MIVLTVKERWKVEGRRLKAEGQQFIQPSAFCLLPSTIVFLAHFGAIRNLKFEI
jgi:hypothetical protein